MRFNCGALSHCRCGTLALQVSCHADKATANVENAGVENAPHTANQQRGASGEEEMQKTDQRAGWDVCLNTEGPHAEQAKSGEMG